MAPLTAGETDLLFAPFAAAHAGIWLIAVSGGSDSTALLQLAAGCIARHPDIGVTLAAATVDHGLRPESAAEAQTAGGQSLRLGVPHAILPWADDKPATGLQAAARAARYRLLAVHAVELGGAAGPAVLLTAHTADDQAETLLMRLARGSGVDGLAAMRAARVVPDTNVMHIRPLLTVPKARLTATLQASGMSWIDDPSNDKRMFERVRIRSLLPVLASEGLTAEAMALSATRLARAAAALDDLTGRLWDACVLVSAAGVQIDRQLYNDAPADLRVRLLQRALVQIGSSTRGGPVPPRLAKIEAVERHLADADAKPVTLAGCRIVPASRTINILREDARRL